uniref:Uncharacterized protein n=1 Tax=Chromera velia CCMP2878 TaxID=1169474 RepID=A0A0G4HJA2_9ALVE|eukprot:Cvel_7110.t1-p1 / transcript=Cvel_7110.t1 / gene=Cvel_7110 / organism=Chromera_velia_CCMP2878 / gene_product=hypothetical protein / transcript_product=hypothetical protein / location=Cvel_scaffold364:47995-55067(+) / protein_length=152 / sequence_SO=supercontig / SO=protein_coding / is_pseudo=false
MSKLAGRVDKGGIFQSRSLFLYRVTGEEGVGAKRGEGDVISLFRARLLTALFKKVLPDSSLRSFDATKNDLSACMRMVPGGGILGGGKATFDLNVRRMCELNGWSAATLLRGELITIRTESLNPLLLYDESINEFQKVTALQIPVHCTVPQR